MMNGNRLGVTTPTDTQVVLTRTFDAPARIVFQAWTTPELFKRWWIPKSMPLPLLSYEADFRVGGTYRLVFGVDGDKTMLKPSGAAILVASIAMRPPAPIRPSTMTGSA